ncbi:Replicative DNA helicase [uncultured Paludibacter sp.]|uniref:Replicative DNA helicase n=1 Tax=uncultured Paludibacter sp. TaxID=497635 RepID=A0A653ACE6_9BACT|nr:Replicative DNA helicase [uncultured Paludibacter sp.]
MAEKRTYNKKETTPSPIPANEYGKLPPQALELEEDVLGAVMLEKDAYSMISDLLKPTYFYKTAHQKIFEAIVDLALHQNPIDMHTVTEQLRKKGTLEEVGGPYYITLLTSRVSSAAHLIYHSQIIVQKYLARELIRLSSDIQTKAFDEKMDVDDLMQEAEGKLFEITQQNLKKDVVQINSVIEEARNRMKDAANRQGSSGTPSGFKDLDKITSGWQRSDLIIIAARPAMGKTAFILSMAKNMAVDLNVPVAIFSLEMSNVQLVNRLLMNVCSLEGEKIKNGNLTPDEWEKFDKDVNLLLDAPIFVDDTPSLSIFELRSKARRLMKEHHIQCLIIDYLQLMNASGMTFGSREQEVSLISRSLKGLAKELDIPIIALSQLNRSVEGRSVSEGKRPQLSDLRESGAIEQDADMVCFIHRPEYYGIKVDPEGNSYEGIAEIIIAKHRNGAVGDVRLKFKNIFAKFLNIADDADPFYSQNFLTVKSKLSTDDMMVDPLSVSGSKEENIPDYLRNPPFENPKDGTPF